MKGDWDLVSSPAEDDAAWDAVSTPISQKKKPVYVKAPVLKRTVLFSAIFLLLALSGGGVFWVVNTHAIHFPVIAGASPAVTPTATATPPPTVTPTVNTYQQIYNQAT